MKDRKEHIVEAAQGLFLRYGVKRTSMGDIAQQASISRQTLYKTFPNKEAVLKAMIGRLADKVVMDIEAGLERAEGLGEQLDVVFKQIAIVHYDFLQSSPNAEDIIAGVNASTQDELEAGAKRNTEIIGRILKPHTLAIEENELTVPQLADFIQRSATAAKYNAKNKKHLLELLTVLRILVLKLSDAS